MMEIKWPIILLIRVRLFFCVAMPKKQQGDFFQLFWLQSLFVLGLFCERLIFL